MSSALISFLFSVGASTWIYTKLQRRSGNNTQQSVIASAIAGVVIFFVLFATLALIA